MNIPRYSFDYRGDCVPDINGNWCKYNDVKVLVAQEKVSLLEKTLNRVDRTIDLLKSSIQR